MITDAEIEEGLKIFGPYKKFPHYFVDYPEVNVLLDLLPKALEEIKRMRANTLEPGSGHLFERMQADIDKLRAENAKLLRVKEAADRVKEWLPDLEPIRGTPRDTDHNKAAWELRAALKALDEDGK